MSGPEHLFFTSYSELDEDAPYVERFHAYVENEVRAQLGKQTPGGGFLDRESIDPGDRWRYRLLHGACTTRTMLALYSPSYYGSEWCAQEWTTFSERRNRYRRDSGAEDEHLLGVTWRNGPGGRPKGFDDQLLKGDFGQLYAKSGLFHLVPEENEPKTPEYKKIVLAIATRLAAVLYRGTELPHLDLTEARTLTPLFGPKRLRAVNVVVAYTDLADDSEWGMSTIAELAKQGYTVDAEVVSATTLGTVDRLRQALLRADRVLVLVSDSFFSHGDLTATALDVALSDGSSDWQRMIPVFIDPPELAALPISFRQFPPQALRDLDEDSIKATLALSAKALAQTSGQPTGTGALSRSRPKPGTGFPGKASARIPTTPTQLRVTLVNALLTASSISDDVIRPIWIRQTDLDVDSLKVGMPTRPLLFELIDLSVRQTGDCAVLATALDALEPGSQASQQVQRIVRRLREAQDTAEKAAESPAEELPPQTAPDDAVSPRPRPPRSALGTS